MKVHKCHLPERLRRALPALACPTCNMPVSEIIDALCCTGCGRVFPVRDGKIFFIEPPQSQDELDSLKNYLKKILGRFYYTVGITLIGPTYPFPFARKVIERVNPKTQLIVDLGSGPFKLHPDVISVDMFRYESVDILCDIANPPFLENSVDAFVSRSVLEHVPRPWVIVDKLFRCTKKGGLGLHLIPFMFPFHASPHDFCRFTQFGLVELFRDWNVLEMSNATGPFSLLVSVLTEFLSVFASCSSDRAKAILYLIFCLLLFPIKFLDFFFVGRKRYMTIAPNIFSIIRKPA